MVNLLIIGGSDAGISAALRAREIDSRMDITVMVADRFPNYSISGLDKGIGLLNSFPYYCLTLFRVA